jgi:alpha-tubulin suppressor-like RCC1 family protein
MKKSTTNMLTALVVWLFLSANASAQVKTWGYNSHGQLGDISQTNRNVPTDAFIAYPDITAFGGGENHTLALQANGTVVAVGYNEYGQLGDGTTTTTGCRCKTTPVVVRNSANTADLQNITAVSGGVNHSLALDKDGKVWAWGSNIQGQLGNNGTWGPNNPGLNLPVQVGAGVDGFDGQVIAVNAGGNHNLALTADGKLWAWGYNFNGQIGDGAGGNGTDRRFPVKVQVSAGVDFGNVLQIAAGLYHSAALRRDGTVWIWGNNVNKEAGNPSVTAGSVLYPAQTKQAVMGNVVQIAAGSFHNVALTQAGEVWIWGSNYDAQLGNGSNVPNLLTEPTKNNTLANIIEINAESSYHILARNRSGQVFAWGYNTEGAVGNGTFSMQTTPYQITSLGAGNAIIGAGRLYSLLSNPVIAVTAGTNRFLSGENVRLNFANITGAGNVSYTAIDPTATGLTPPMGYTILANQPAYNVTTTATTSGNIDVCLNVTGEFDLTAFNNLEILHGEGANLVDRTYSSSYVRRQICARVTSLSPFVIAQGLTPTAASVSVGGRVSFGKGSFISRASVTLTDMNGNVKTAVVNPFGYYKFEDVSAGQTVTVQVSAKGSTFAPQVVTVTEDIEDLNFSAQ